MNKEISIVCPEGLTAEYDETTNRVIIRKVDITEKVKTVADANQLSKHADEIKAKCERIQQLLTIVDALNEDHKFDPLTGQTWYPLLCFKQTLEDTSDTIGTFVDNELKRQFKVIVNIQRNSPAGGIGFYYKSDKIGYTNFASLLACKSEKLAQYVATTFGKFLFETCFAEMFITKRFEWIDNNEN